jgi:hypothetical protein
MAYLWTDVNTDRASTPEFHLVGAILYQVLTDARSRRQDVREEALAFLANPAHLRYWDDFLGLDGALQRYVRDVVSERP